MKDIRLIKLLLDISYNMISDVVVNIDDETRIAYRHSNRSNSLFWDGHVGTFSRLIGTVLWGRMTVTCY